VNDLNQICGDKVKAAKTIDELKTMLGETVTIEGCVHRVRDMGSIRFFVLRTGRYLIQTVYAADECSCSVDDLKVGCYVRVTGLLREEPRAVYGLELSIRSAELLSAPQEEYPLKVGNRRLGCSLDANLDNRSVALRNPYERAVFKLTEGVVSGFREFMLQNGFTEIHSPKIVAAGAEGGANLFELDYFEQKAYLSQSPQFYKQTAVAFFDRVFEVGPVFRAERHSTSRHLNEYMGLDFEMGFIDSMVDVMETETAMLKYVCQYLKDHYQNELMILNPDIPDIKTIPSITFMEAVELLGGRQRYDLSPDDEVALCEYAKKEFDSEFIFVTHFPAAKRPFYAMNDREDSRFALSFDLLFRGLEITTGGQRIHDYNEQVEKIKAMNMDPDDLEVYLKIHKYGMPPHGGLGIGLERLVMKLLDRANIRETSMFPRDINRLDP
jgi:nondiscriminating aspartyl-tRNA synthetase